MPSSNNENFIDDPNMVNAGSVDVIEYCDFSTSIQGWAICKNEYATRIEVYLNHQLTSSECTLGLERPDVAEALKKPSWQNSGWKATIFTPNLDSGEYHLSVMAYSSDNNAINLLNQINTQKIIVNNFDDPDFQSGKLEHVLFDQKSGLITFRGWVVSNKSKIKEIQIEFDNSLLPVKCFPGLPRPDIADSFDQPTWLHCGWIAQIALDQIPQFLLSGKYLPKTFAVPTHGERWPLKNSPQIRQLIFAEDQLLKTNFLMGSVERVDYKSSLNELEIRGWAINSLDPVESIEIYIDTAHVPADVELNLPNPDAAASHGRDEWRSCGWRAIVTSDTLLSGCHNIFVYATGKSGWQWQLNNAKETKIIGPAIPLLGNTDIAKKITQAVYIALLHRAPSITELEAAALQLIESKQLVKVIKSMRQSTETQLLNSLERNKKAINFQASFLSEEKIVFFHIPKTGGTTINAALLKNFRAEEVFNCYDNSISVNSSGTLARYRFFSGHFDLPNVTLIPGKKKIISFFREPISRLVSHYYFYRAIRPELVANLNHRFPALAHKYSLREFFESPEIRLHRSDVDNLMTRMLTGNYTDEAMDILPLALKALNDLSVFGIMERYDESVKLIFNYLNLPLPDQLQSLNGLNQMMVSEPDMRPIAKEPLTDEVVNSMHDLIEADQIVYAEALKLFKKRVQETA